MTTISLHADMKEDLALLKPEEMSWTEFLRVLVETVDRERLAKRIQELLTEEHELAMERIRTRYQKARDDPNRLLTPGEARKEMHRLRDG